MARLAGTGGSVSVATNDIDGIKSWTLDQTFDALESTAFDSSAHRAYIPGLDGWSGSFEGYKNQAPLTIGTEIALILEEVLDSGTQCFSGSAIITGLHVTTAVDGLVAYSYDFQGTGALTIATG